MPKPVTTATEPRFLRDRFAPMPPRFPTPLPRASSGLKWLGFFYFLLIIYGSLFPLTGWQAPLSWSNPIMSPWPTHASRADILVNLLAYFPLGLLLSMI